MDHILSKYYLFFLINVIIIYGTGSLGFHFLKIKISDLFANLFLKLLLGTVLWVVIAAVFISKGKTIMLSFFIIGLFLFIESRKKTDHLTETKIQTNKSKEKLKIHLELFLAATFIYLIKYFLNFSLAGFPIAPNLDNNFYADTSLFIATTGIETSVPNFLEISKNSIYPYHYFELWLNGISTKFLNTNYNINFLLVTNSLLSLLLYLGYRAVFTLLYPARKWASAISFLFIFYASFFIFYNGNIALFKSADVFMVNAFSLPKLIPIYIFLLAAFMFFLKKKYSTAVVFLLCLPILFITVAPAVLSSLAISSALLFILSKNQEVKKYALKSMIYTGIIAIFIACFYFIFSQEEQGYSGEVGESFLNNFISLTYWRTFFNIFAGASIQIISLNIIPILAFTFLLIKRRNIFSEGSSLILTAIILLFFSSGLCFWAISHELLNSIQLLTNLFVPLSHILIFWLLVTFIKYFSVKNYFNYGIGAALLVLGVSKTLRLLPARSYSEKFLMEISSETQNVPKLGVFLTGSNENSLFYWEVPESSSVGSYLSFIRQDLYTVNLSVFDHLADPATAKVNEETPMVKSASFYRFVEKQKRNNQFSNLPQSQLEYIKQNKVSYITATKSAKVPFTIQPLIKKEISDEISGERFIILNN